MNASHRAVPIALILLMLPATMAQDGPDDRFLGASKVFVDDLPLERLSISTPQGGALATDPTDPTACTSAGEVVVDPSADFFRFRDGTNDASCAEAQMTITVPEGADGLVLRFRADRTVQQSSAATVPPDALQAVRFYDDKGTLLAHVDYLDPADTSRPMQDYIVAPDLDLPAGAMTVAWVFEDRGTDAVGGAVMPLPGQSLTATIASPELEFAPIELTPASVQPGTEAIAGERYSSLSIRLDLDGTGSEAYSTRLLARTVDGFEVQALGTPGGRTVDAQEVLESRDETGLTFVVPEGVVGAAGPGPYTLKLVSSSPLDPVRVPALAAIAVMLPGIVGVVAVTGFQRYRRIATPDQNLSLLSHAVAQTALVLGYVGVVVWILATGILEGMGAIPVSQDAWAGYALLLAIGLLFFLSWGQIVVERRRAREIRHAEQLARSNRDLEQFAYVASHDLQEPLRKVVSYTSLLERRYDEELDARGRKYLHNAADGAKRMRNLVQALLEFSRIGSDRRQEPVDMDHCMEVIQEDFKDLMRKTKAQVGADHPLPTVEGDPQLLHQLLTNLVGNALKYRHPDRAPVVRIQARRLRSEWEFCVADNGIGMEQEYLQKAFIIFQRLQVKGSDVQGTGIGLALCQRIVEMHGGRIWARSEPGVGSRFYFTLPAMGGRP